MTDPATTMLPIVGAQSPDDPTGPPTDPFCPLAPDCPANPPCPPTGDDRAALGSGWFTPAEPAGKHSAEPSGPTSGTPLLLLDEIGALHPQLMVELTISLRWDGRDTGPAVTDLILPDVPLNRSRPPRQFRAGGSLFTEARTA